MAAPLKARGAKSRANLKRGGQKGRTAQKIAEDKAARKLARRLLSDPQYLKGLRRRLRTGVIQPGVEAMLYYYAHGKPAETVEAKVITPVRITHEYTE